MRQVMNYNSEDQRDKDFDGNPYTGEGYNA